MNWFQKTLHAIAGTPGPTDDFWYKQVGGGGNAGPVVNHSTAMQSSVVYAAVKVISGSIGALPFKLYRRSGKNKTELPEHPLYRLLHEQANEEHTSQEFIETMTGHAVLRGTAYAEILPGAKGPVDQLVPFHPETVRPLVETDGQSRRRIRYEINVNGEPRRMLLRQELLVYRALVLGSDGISGIDPIMAEANAISARLASQEYAARFFANDAQAGLILKHPANFKSTEDRDRFLEGWQQVSTGNNRHGTRVLEYGIEPHTVSMTNEQSQFLETQKYQDVDIARIFNIPPHKLGILDRATFSNIEQQSIEWVTDTLMPWAVRWTQCVKRDLILQRTVFAEHSFAALLRGDTEARFRAYAIARNWGWMSANDVRSKENENTIGPDGDVYLQPLNMVPADQPSEPAGVGGPAQPMQPQNGASNGRATDHEIRR